MRKNDAGAGGDNLWEDVIDAVSDCDNTFDLLELSTEGIFSPIKSKVQETSFSYFEEKDGLDASLSVSFGSMSEPEDVKENFSMLANPDLSTKHMEEISTSKASLETDIHDDIYFQASQLREYPRSG